MSAKISAPEDEIPVPLPQRRRPRGSRLRGTARPAHTEPPRAPRPVPPGNQGTRSVKLETRLKLRASSTALYNPPRKHRTLSPELRGAFGRFKHPAFAVPRARGGLSFTGSGTRSGAGAAASDGSFHLVSFDASLRAGEVPAPSAEKQSLRSEDVAQAGPVSEAPRAGRPTAPSRGITRRPAEHTHVKRRKTPSSVCTDYTDYRDIPTARSRPRPQGRAAS